MILSSIPRSVCAAALLFAVASASRAYVDDAMSFAYEAANPYAEKGWIIREDAWGGDLGAGDKKAVSAQLFRGNSYMFFLGTDIEGASLRVNIYDAEGKLAETKSWQEGKFSYAEIKPRATGTYYVVVEVLSSPEERTGWALVYGFRR
ncbi:MAG: hypothetical protein JHD33_07770 [Chthoniobacterales bacterium]|jgi:hypothetical protein|nr:hypothetical protein [Chthoniobacterales bacterium]